MTTATASFRSWWSTHWFLPVLCGLLVGGTTVGLNLTADWHAPLTALVHPGVTTGAILFLMAWSLETGRLRDSLRAPGPVLVGTLINIGLLPLMAWPISALPWPDDFRLGLLITAAVPCTLATASVWTRKAGGNDAVSLLITLVTNIAGIVLTPLWLQLTVARGAQIAPWPIVQNLALAVLLPTLLGQLCRLPNRGREFAVRRAGLLSLAAQVLVLTMVATAAVRGGAALRNQTVWPHPLEGLGLMAVCAGLHVAAMLLAVIASRLLRFRREDGIALVFAGSQKTLPIALLLAADPHLIGTASYPFITFPMLVFHALQLLIDSAVAQRIALRSVSAAAAPASPRPGR